MRQVRLDPDHDAVMRIGGEAPGGGPILSVGISAMSCCGSTPPRIVSQHSPAKASGCRKGKKMCLCWRGFQLAGRRMTPSSSSPVVTKRQSPMSSLRARATIIVLRVLARPSAVRA